MLQTLIQGRIVSNSHFERRLCLNRNIMTTIEICRKYRKEYKAWKTRSSTSGAVVVVGGGGGSSSISVGGSTGGSGTKQYSNKWWFWTEIGRKTWKECKAKGKDSPYWKDSKCDTRQKPAKGSKWWWWTSTGRTVWKQCKEKGDTSPFWKENDCEAGRYVHTTLIFAHADY